MKKYTKIHLISDIHGYFEGLEQAAGLSNSQSPLVVLGDLFDHKYGDENKIIDLLLNLQTRNELILIKGNHDIIVELVFNQVVADEEAINKLTKERNLKKFKVLRTIFDDQFYLVFLKLRDQLFEANVSDSEKLKRYYLQMKQLTSKPQYLKRYQQLQTLLSLFIDYVEVQVNDLKLLLSHSGDINNSFSRDTAKPLFQLDSKYDYGIMGHLTIPCIEKMIVEEGDMLDFESNFKLNYPLAGLSIKGEYMYNKHSKMIMIDNGTHQNIVTIY